GHSLRSSFFFQAEDGIRDFHVTGVQTCALPILQTASEFLANRRLVDFVLTANGVDPETVTNDFMKQVFASDLSDPESFVNLQDEIGRASCRERVEDAAVGGAVQEHEDGEREGAS